MSVTITSVTPNPTTDVSVNWQATTQAFTTATFRLATSSSNLDSPGTRTTINSANALPDTNFTALYSQGPGPPPPLKPATVYWIQAEADSVLSAKQTFQTIGFIPKTIDTGKNNMLATLRAYLQTNLPGQITTGPYTIELEQYENAEVYPSISFEDLGMPSMGGHAFDDFIEDGTDDNGNKVSYYGKIAQTIVEFNCQAQANANTSALQQCYQMRDQLEQLFMFSGRVNHAGIQLLPPITLTNYDTSPASSTGSLIWAPMERDSIWMESFVGTDISRPGIKRLSIRVRLYWHLLEA